MKRSKLIITMYIAMLGLLVASVSMSVAWFVASSQLYVNAINISFDAERDLKISESKDDGYSEHIDHSVADPTGVFIPVTSAHSSLWTSQRNDSPIFYDESNASEMEHIDTFRAVADNYGYFSRKYYLLADDDLIITIDPDKTSIVPDKIYNKTYAEHLYEFYQNSHDDHYAKYKEYSVDELYEKLNKVVDAMRFSILINDGDEYTYAIIDPNYKEETLIGGLLDNSVDQYYDSFQKEGTNDFYERIYGEYSGVPVYDEPLAQDSDLLDPNDPSSAFNARHKKGVRTFNLERSINENNFKFESEGAFSLEDFRKDKKPFTFKAYMDTPKEVIVSIYIEGWDLDSVNYTMGASFSSKLTFKVEREF